MNDDYLAKRQKVKRRIAPGLWIDENDCGHLNIDELLKFAGLPNTPDNHRIVREMVDEIFSAQDIIPIHRTGIKPPGQPEQ